MRRWTIFRRMVESGMVFVLIFLLIWGSVPNPLTVHGANQDMSMEDLDWDALRSVLESVETYGIGGENPSKVLARGAGQTVTVTRGNKIVYPESLGGWSTFYYYLDDQLAYCLEPPKKSPPTGTTVTVNPLTGNDQLAKALYYGYGGPGDCTGEILDWAGLDLRYLFTHIAVSFAYCGWEAFKGCTQEQLEASGVWYYINYINSLPQVPDAFLQFSNSNLKAYLDESIQRTESITLTGDSRNSIELSLPSGITLHNNTQNTKITADKAIIHGGDSFYFSAPLTVTGSYESGELQGSLDNRWKAVIASGTEERQTLGGFMVFNEETKPVSLRIQWLDMTRINLEKTDHETKNPVEGAVYGIYKDKACENLLMELKPTDQDGKTSSGLFPFEQSDYYVREISVPQGYLMDTKVYTVNTQQGKTSEIEVDDQVTRGAVKAFKVDSVTGEFRPQGDASLEGALYGLYAREDIVHPDAKTGLIHPAGTLVEEKKFGKEGWIEFTNLYQGIYYLKEITPPSGYKADAGEYDLDLSWIDGETPVVSKEVTVKEEVKKQAFQILKVSGNGSSMEQPKVQGAQFTVKLKGEVEQKGWEKAQTYDVLTTDKQGAATSKELPFGTYLVRETEVPAGMEQVKDFVVEVMEDSRTPQFWRVFNDKPFEAYLRIKKVDKSTGRTILLAGATFQIKNLKTGEKVVQKVGDKKIHEFVTDETGTVTTPLKLGAGEYEITELRAPQGYVINKEKVTITIGSPDAVQLVSDDDQDVIVDVQMEDDQQKGRIELLKHGEKLSAFDEGFIYEDKPLEHVKFQLLAAEDIYTPDHQLGEDGRRILAEYKGELLKKGCVIGLCTTDQDGKALWKDLPFGSYQIEEVQAQDGFVKLKEGVVLNLEAGDQEEEVITVEYDCPNERQKTKLSLTKVDKEGGKPLEGAVYGVYAGQDIKDEEGRILIPKDTCIQEKTTDGEGTLCFDADMPPEHYYVTELSPPKGYIRDETSHPADLAGDGTEEVITLHLKLQNQREVIPSVTPKPMDKSEAGKSEPVKTGDTNNRWQAYLAMIVSGSICGGFLIIKLNRRKKHFPEG